MDDELENDVDSDEEEKMSSSEIRINLISSHKLDSMSSAEKLRFILDEVKKGNVLVLERGLTAEEEIDLIRKTMSEIDHESFIGIETPTFPIDFKKKSLLDRLFKRTQSPRMMVVGPAHLLKTIKKDGMMIQTRVLTGRSIVAKVSDDENGTDEEETSEEELVDDIIEKSKDEITEPASDDSDDMYHAPAEESETEVGSIEEDKKDSENDYSYTASGTDQAQSQAPLAEPVDASNSFEENSNLEPQDSTIEEPEPVLDPFQVQPFEIPEAPSTETNIDSETQTVDRDEEKTASNIETESTGSTDSAHDDSDNSSSFLLRRMKHENEEE
jgi:hypothetical protein